MSRLAKRGLDYFPLDVDVFSDVKLRKLIKRNGGESMAVYIALLSLIYRDGYYIKFDEDLPFLCADLTGLAEEYSKDVITTCISVGLFDERLYGTDHILTSKSIQERYARICAQCRRVCRIDTYSLVGNSEQNDIEQEQVLSPYSHSLSLAQECELLKKEEGWLETIEVLHHMRTPQLITKIDDFYKQCVADGKVNHNSMSDVKKHFNNWLRRQRQNESTSKDNKPYRELQELCNTQFALE